MCSCQIFMGCSFLGAHYPELLYLTTLTHVKSNTVACVRSSSDGMHGNKSGLMSNTKTKYRLSVCSTYLEQTRPVSMGANASNCSTEIMFSTGDLLQRKYEHRVSVEVLWLLLSRLLHAGGGFVLLGTQQTLIFTAFTISVSKNCEMIAGKNACLIRKRVSVSLVMMLSSFLQLKYILLYAGQSKGLSLQSRSHDPQVVLIKAAISMKQNKALQLLAIFMLDSTSTYVQRSLSLVHVQVFVLMLQP